MDANTLKAIDLLLDKIAEVAEKQLDSAELRRLVADLGKPRCSKCGHEVDRQKVVWG